MVRLVFAVWQYRKIQQSRVLLRFCFLEIVFQEGLPGVSPTMAKKWSVLNKIVVLERPVFEACQNWIFGWFAGWLASDVWKYDKMQQPRGPARFC